MKHVTKGNWQTGYLENKRDKRKKEPYVQKEEYENWEKVREIIDGRQIERNN